jgi:hypothetical protein
MKKLTLLLLATVYFICASGVYVHAHFCGGELASVNYFISDDDASCGCGDEAEDSDCCKDVLHFYKVDAHQDGHHINASEIDSQKLISLTSAFILFVPASFALKIKALHTNGPPPYLFAKASKLIVNSVFRL